MDPQLLWRQINSLKTQNVKSENVFELGGITINNKIRSRTWSFSISPVEGTNFLILAPAAQTLFVIYIRDSIALRFEPFKRMYENGSKIALNSTCSKGFKLVLYLYHLYYLIGFIFISPLL